MKRWCIVVALAVGAAAGCGNATLTDDGPSATTTTMAFVGSEDSVPSADETSTVASTVTEPEVTSATDARAQGLPFEPGVHEMCEWFTPDEVLAMVADAYAAEEVEYSLPAMGLEARPIPADDGIGCVWAVPGNPGGWPSGDFLILFSDHSDIRLYTDSGQDGATHLEDYHNGTSGESGYRAGVSELLPDTVEFLGGFSPGFSVYVEQVDRMVDFRHDLAASEWITSDGSIEQPEEDFRVEFRILTTMLSELNWAVIGQT